MIRPIRIRAGGEAPSRNAVSYWCVNGHHTLRQWSDDAIVPELWECHCGLPAGRDRAHPPAPVPWRPFKSPLAHLLERRSEAECEALLDEAVQSLRARPRGSGRPGSTRGTRS